MTAPSYSSDQPITTKEDEGFNRWPFAKRIADTIATRDDVTSLVVGIYGAWGDGKTSVLSLIEQELASHEGVVVLHFNPWLFGSGTQLIESFFATLAYGLGKKLTTKKEEIGKLIKDYGSALSIAGVGNIDKLGETLSAVGLSALRDRVQKILVESEQQVVVLIDDIDRLERQDVQAIFKLVKIAAGFERICYVLAFDDEVVAAALGSKYGEGNVAAGRRFLEKIVQVPLPLPPADSDSLRMLAFEGVDATLKANDIELSELDVNTLVRHFIAGFQSRLRTPRLAKLYVNSLAFGVPILKGEVNAVDQMLVEGMRLFYPRLYTKVRSNPDIVLGPRTEAFGRENWRDDAKKILEETMDDLTADDRESAWEVLKALFPRLDMGYGPEWEEHWEKEQQVRARHYFSRYFHYGVPPGDVSDFKVQELAAMAERKEDIGTFLDELCDRRSASRFVSKLRSREKSEQPDAAESIAYGMAHVGENLPTNDGMFGLASTRQQAAILIDRLLRRLPEGERRENAARRIMSEATPLPFATEILRWIRPAEDEEPLVSTEVRGELERILANRIKDHPEPVYKVWSEDGRTLLYIWSKYGSHEEVEAYLTGRLHDDPKEVIEVLLAFTGTAWGMESGIPHKADFDRDSYNALASIISPTTVLEAVKRLFGEVLERPEFYGGRDSSLEERLAHQFAHAHQAAQNQPEVPPGTDTGQPQEADSDEGQSQN